MMRLAIGIAVLVLLAGCGLLPEVSHQPTLHNPFPQLHKVAIAPFNNLSTEPKVDGRQFAAAYFKELQLIPGFEVVPVGVVEEVIREHRLALDSPADVRRLARILEVDAVVIGSVTDFSPYYPPRCGLQVEWYTANPCFHPVPAGYGLPWGTPEEEYIPAPLVLEAELALAREQLKTQTPDGVVPAPLPASDASDASGPPRENKPRPAASRAALASASGGPVAQDVHGGEGLPDDWPDPRGFVPPPPQHERPACFPSDEPVLQHTRIYNGHDADFTAALSNYV